MTEVLSCVRIVRQSQRQALPANAGHFEEAFYVAVMAVVFVGISLFCLEKI